MTDTIETPADLTVWDGALSGITVHEGEHMVLVVAPGNQWATSRAGWEQNREKLSALKTGEGRISSNNSDYDVLVVRTGFLWCTPHKESYYNRDPGRSMTAAEVLDLAALLGKAGLAPSA